MENIIRTCRLSIILKHENVSVDAIDNLYRKVDSRKDLKRLNILKKMQ